MDPVYTGAPSSKVVVQHKTDQMKGIVIVVPSADTI